MDKNKDNNSTHFTFSILFTKQKREETEIRHVLSCYEKNQLPSLTSTQLVLFDEVQVKQVGRPPTTSRVNDYNVLFPRDEQEKLDVEKGVYDTNNQPKKATFKYKQEGRFCLGVAKVENKEYGKITGKHCPVFEYTGNKVVMKDAHKQ